MYRSTLVGSQRLRSETRHATHRGATSADSCGWTRLFKKLPFVVDGDLVRISGWARQMQGTQNTGAQIALGTRNNGVLSIHASEASFAFE